MVVNEEDIVNIMGGMEHAGGIRLNDHKRKLKNRFEIRKKLGQGTYGKVQLGVNKESGQEVAIKTIKKSKIETEADLIRIRREIQIMSSVQHPNIIHIYEVFENKEKMVLVMEIAAGGELYDFLSERKCLEEHEARRIFRQIATAVYYCHKHNICHRDLKLENILLDENGCAKIADFGLSNVYDGKNLLNTFCGSPLYASPEIVRGNPYAGPEVDCWSLGVLLYTLVYGAMPFDGSNFKRLVKQITTGDYYEPKQPAQASDLIRTMLTVGSDTRANIADICSHWWVNEGYGNKSCLEEAEYLAGLTPVRLDLLLSLAAPGSAVEDSMKDAVLVEPTEDDQQAITSPVQSQENESAMSIVELPPGTIIPDTAEDEASEVSISEPPDDKSPPARKRKTKDHKAKRKMTETPTLLDPDLTYKKRNDVAATHEVITEHSKQRNSKGRSSPGTPCVNRPLTPEGNSINVVTGLDLVSSTMEDESSNNRRRNRTNDGTVQSDKKQTAIKSPTPVRAVKEGRKTPVKRKKEVIDVDTTDKQLHPPVDHYPQISPDLQRKPPPKPKNKKSDDIGEEFEANTRPGSSAVTRRRPKKEREHRERNVRTPDPERDIAHRERNVITPDPTTKTDSGNEDNDSNLPFERPCPVLERPPTPRQARAPSPEDRLLVVPLPPPRLPDTASPQKNQPFNFIPNEKSPQQHLTVVDQSLPNQHLIYVEKAPPPIPARPLSMQIDTHMYTLLNATNNKSFSRDNEPPPIPERSYAGAMQVNKASRNEQKVSSINIENISNEHKEQAVSEQQSSELINSAMLNNEKEGMDCSLITESAIVKVEEPNNSINEDIRCSKGKGLLSKDIMTKKDPFYTEAKATLEVSCPIADLTLPTAKNVSKVCSDISQEASTPSSLISNRERSKNCRSPKLNSNTRVNSELATNELNSKSVISTSPILESTTHYDNSISSNRKCKDIIQTPCQFTEENTASTPKTQSFVELKPTPISEVIIFEQDKPSDASVAKGIDDKSLHGIKSKPIMECSTYVNDIASNVPSLNVETSNLNSTKKPNAQHKSKLGCINDEEASTITPKEDEPHPIPVNLELEKNEKLLIASSKPATDIKKEDPNTYRDPDAKRLLIIDSAHTSMESANKTNSSAALKPKTVLTEKSNEHNPAATPDPQIKQQPGPPQKISIKQQLQQAALQKIQQQQARHAMNISKNIARNQKSTIKTAEEQILSSNAKTRIAMRPKTPQTLEKKTGEPFSHDSTPISNNEKETMSPASALISESTANGLDSNGSGGSSSGKQDDTRSLINSIPKPFKPESNWNEKSESPSSLQACSINSQKNVRNDLRKENTSDSIASAISLSSSGSNNSLPRPTTLPSKVIGRPFNDLSSASPGGSSSSLQKPDKRDSKVIKAAQYWNNFIGDVMTRNKLAENTKTFDKPKKIISAGVGQKGYNDLKTAFEQKNKKQPVPAPEKSGMQRRNSKKLSIDGCQPGLRVTDALSVFEMKNQASTPIIYRRNSVNNGQPKWSTKHKEQQEYQNDNKPTSPVTVILKKEDIENMKKVNNGIRSPDPAKMTEIISKPKVKEIAEHELHKKDAKNEARNLSNGIDNEQSLDEMIQFNGYRKFEYDVKIKKSAEKQNDTTSTSLLNNINDKNNSIIKEKYSKENKSNDSSSHRPNKYSKPETSPKPKLKKDNNNAKQNNDAYTKQTQKNESFISSLKPKYSDSITEKCNEKAPVNVTPLPSSNKDAIQSTPKNTAVSSPNEVTKEVQLKGAKSAAVDLISREISKRDVGVHQTEESAGITTNSLIKNKVEIPAGSDIQQSNKSVNNNDLPLQGTKIKLGGEDIFKHESAGTAEVVTDVGNTMALSVVEFKTYPTTQMNEDQVGASGASTNKTPEAQYDQQPQNQLEAIKNSLKKIPHAPAMRNRTSVDNMEDQNTIPYNTIEQWEPKHTIDKLTSSVLIGSNNKQQDNTSIPPPNKSSNVTTDKNKTSSPPTPSTSTANTNITTNNLKSDKDNDIITVSKSTRIIPIKIERDTKTISESQNTLSDNSTSNNEIKENAVENRKEEHYIPIMVEGKGMINKVPITSSISREDQDEANERLDTFHSNSLSRRRFGSRKKRMSSAYSDSSGISDDGSELGGTTFSGLQRFSSLGKHGLEQNVPVLKLRKTRPPFTMQRSDSFSSGEDDFDDDGFREMTAENLFSTLLTRVKSLTRRIHDEHEEQIENRWKQNQRILNHPLNPGGTHARLERSAQRNSIKREKPPDLSRQFSTDSTSRFSTYDDGTSSVRSFGGGSARGDNGLGDVGNTSSLIRSYATTKDNGRDDAGSTYSGQSLQRGTSKANWSDTESIYSESIDDPQGIPYVTAVQAPNRYELSSSSAMAAADWHSDAASDLGSNISVTSRQRLRPGYLPPPYLHPPDTTSTSNYYNYDVSVDGGAGCVSINSPSSTTTTSSYNAPITSQVEVVQDSNSKIHEHNSTLLAKELAKPYNTTTTNKLESSSAILNADLNSNNIQNDKKIRYPSSIYVKIVKPFIAPPPLPMKTESRDAQEINSMQHLESNDNKVEKQANNEPSESCIKGLSQYLNSNIHDTTNENHIKHTVNSTEERDINKSLFVKSVHARKLINVDTSTAPSSPITAPPILNMPPSFKEKEDVLVATGVLSPQPKVNPHEATKKLEIQIQSNLTNPIMPSEGTRTSPITVLSQSSIANNGNPLGYSRQSSRNSNNSSNMHSSNTKDRLRKSSRTYLPSEREMINRLYKEAAERTHNAGPDTFSDGYDETESLGSPDVDELSTASEREWERMRKRSYLRRLDEDSALTNLSRPVTRRSISRELFNDVATIDPANTVNNSIARMTSARPVTRRSVSRELQLMDVAAAATQGGRVTPTSAFVTSPRRSVTDYPTSFARASRERSLGKDDYDSSAITSLSRPIHGGTGRRSESLSRGTAAGIVSPSSTTPSRAPLASHGRSLTQNEFGHRNTPKIGGVRSTDGYSNSTSADDDFGLLRPGSLATSVLSSGTSSTANSRFSTNLEDRGRSDWRRISVPERGKDFKSLPRKYNRVDKSKQTYLDLK